MFVEHDSLKLSHVRQSFDFEIGVRWKDLICFVLFWFITKKTKGMFVYMYVTVVTLQALSYDVHERPSTSR